MDSASPIVKRTAGEQVDVSGILFTFTMWTTKAGEAMTRLRPFGTGTRTGATEGTGTGFGPAPGFEFDLPLPRGYRDARRRSYGEGHRPA